MLNTKTNNATKLILHNKIKWNNREVLILSQIRYSLKNAIHNKFTCKLRIQQIMLNWCFIIIGEIVPIYHTNLRYKITPFSYLKDTLGTLNSIILPNRTNLQYFFCDASTKIMNFDWLIQPFASFCWKIILFLISSTFSYLSTQECGHPFLKPLK